MEKNDRRCPFGITDHPAEILHGTERVVDFLAEIIGGGILSSDRSHDGISDDATQGLANILFAVSYSLLVAQELYNRDFEEKKPKDNHGEQGV
jgi:hypothetical protein